MENNFCDDLKCGCRFLSGSPTNNILNIINIIKNTIKMAEEYQSHGKCNSEYVKISLANAKSVISAFENPRLGSNPYSLYTITEMERINWQLNDSLERSE